MDTKKRELLVVKMLNEENKKTISNINKKDDNKVIFENEGKNYTLGDFKKLEEKNSINIDENTKYDLLIFYDDMIQLMGVGFIYYLLKISEDKLLTKKETEKLSYDVSKYILRNDFDLFTHLSKVLKLKYDNPRMKNFYSLYNKLYLYLMEISPVTNILRSVVDLSFMLDNLIIVFEFELPDNIKKTLSNSLKKLFKKKSDNVTNIEMVSNNSFEDIIYGPIDFFYNKTKKKNDKLIMSPNGVNTLEYTLDKGIEKCNIIVPRFNNNFSKEFLDEYYRTLDPESYDDPETTIFLNFNIILIDILLLGQN